MIDSKAVKSLVDAQAIHGATVLGQPGGWAVLVRYGALEKAVAAQRSRQMRLWRHLDTAASFIRDELHLPRFEVDAVGHEPEAVERRRPDTAERQRQAHAAAEHDRWFRAEVQKALVMADDPATVWVAHEDVKARWATKRAALVARIEASEDEA
ncbi:hypothetical protein [Microvirga pudoricolor]|uniref:hypothetical protein n=1 Tax=Microvirga pudoricolor TaxID=2778729 RepID=UPI00194EE3D6|nr:hypothetical protein [Microvirga pudoricolor]MBM6593961.1 hypothetical protein [Microvirga pudoricolor]